VCCALLGAHVHNQQYGISNEMEFMSGRGQMNHRAKGTRQRNGEAQDRMERQIAKLRRTYRQRFKEQLQEVLCSQSIPCTTYSCNAGMLCESQCMIIN
jgi:hypothetical protein